MHSYGTPLPPPSPLTPHAQPLSTNLPRLQLLVAATGGLQQQGAGLQGEAGGKLPLQAGQGLWLVGVGGLLGGPRLAHLLPTHLLACTGR